MRQELKLRDIDHSRELKDNFTRVGTEFLRLPSFGVDSGVEQLSDGEFRILTAAVYDFVRLL